ncbi:MAG: benzoate/H(+) symporter BenE family transporter [Gammaproteobacteria bacterium]|nr:benzoate/H(+) symporter BenE family transporter [Gammaproteobacteria bacterium]MBU1506209.1 benzoate/H(+) symporter BenE family transporter [Gammaproteobacteria bacterium]MBU2119838.1 benzoate/H(+) symporter BenE family transporter [Gammaproteobacteria bacterium]MBU2170410.1 benzoate/H(+) symporter BenE family transporter [Gammaproteobacteria bacterium]MBU2203025.1 benzoate/H(+) symporter BenE family transporter [Gammaproteobacteria bacterium]
MQFFKDLSLSAATAGFVAVLVGFTSSVAIVFQAAQAFGATPVQITSWMWALGLGMGLCSLVPSLVLRKPVMIAWSTPGAAVLATAGAAGGFGMGDAVGAFMVSAALITLVGATGWFERVMNRIPMEIAAALLAGVLARFGLQAFTAAQTALPLVLLMLGVYLVSRRWVARYAVVITLAVAVSYVASQGQMTWSAVQLELAIPVLTVPVFSVAATVSLAIPLFVVTMASQNLPGVAVIRASGYDLPVSQLLTLTGLATLVLAPFGAFALNFSAITAAMCMGPEAHADRSRRYAAAVSCGALYVAIGLFGAVITGLLTAFPNELVVAIAGLALLGTIGNGLAAAMREESHREAALLTFLVTLSGVVIAGVGSAFWGVVAGSFALFVQQYRRSRAKGV